MVEREKEIRRHKPRRGHYVPKDVFDDLQALDKENFERLKAIGEKYRDLDPDTEYDGALD